GSAVPSSRTHSPDGSPELLVPAMRPDVTPSLSHRPGHIDTAPDPVIRTGLLFSRSPSCPAAHRPHRKSPPRRAPPRPIAFTGLSATASLAAAASTSATSAG